MDQKALQKAGIKKLLLSGLSLIAIVFAEIVGVIVVIALNIPFESLWSNIITEVFGAVAAVACVIMLGGASWAKPSRDDVVYTMRYGWWILLVACGLFAYELFDFYRESAELAPNWPVLAAGAALLCLGIGIFEEFLFRGVIFNGLLAAMGGTRKGVLRAVVLSSLIFGLAHLNVTEDFSGGLRIAQALLKLVQTGVYGVILCAVVLHTRHLGGASLFHGLDDFLLVVISLSLYREPLSTDYVMEGDEGLQAIVLYLIVIALYLPVVIKSVRDLLRNGYVTRGAFMEREEREAAEFAVRQQAAVDAYTQQGLAGWPPVQPQSAVADERLPVDSVPGPVTVPAQPVSAQGNLSVPDTLSGDATGAPRHARRNGLPPVPKGFE